MLSPDLINQSFLSNTISVDELFGVLTPLDRQQLVSKRKLFVHDSKVFESGDPPLEIYMHRIGRVALISGDNVFVEVHYCPFEPDRIYGIVEALSGHAFENSMKAITDSEFDVISRDNFLGFVREQPDLCFKLAQILGRLYQKAILAIRSQ